MTPGMAPADTSTDHVAITPSVLYFGTPVVLLTTENEDGSVNLAPMSSAWALGQVVVLGLGIEGQTAHNLRSRPDLVINLPAPAQWPAVERLAPLTGRTPVPVHKRGRFRFRFESSATVSVPRRPARAPRRRELRDRP
jgi:flavin reductase (DIM6/NTAB) family NADH-FMN oxidoreductase RutF